MTRIIAGTAKGRPLRVPGSGTRPTSDRVKESLFSMLEHSTGGFAGMNVVDLFAGSGALGLEAASRGAAAVVLVERAPAAVRVIEANIAATRLTQAKVVAADATVWAAAADAGPGAGWDLVLLDPPYDMADVDVARLLAVLVGSGSLADGCEVVVERARRRGQPEGTFPWPADFTALRERTYGDTVVHHAVCYRHEREQTVP